MNAPSPLQPEFVQFGPAHLTVIVLLVVVSVTLSVMVRNSRSEKTKRSICWALAAILLGGEWLKRKFLLFLTGGML